MALGFKFRKSAGVPVTATVHRLIARGNRARTQRDWRAAAEAYGAALKADPGLGHIWLQQGHMLKEAGDRAAARAAYETALARDRQAAEPHVHLGHLARLSGDRARAARHFLDAVRADPAHADAATELHREIGRATGEARTAMITSLRETMADLAVEPDPARAAATGPAIVFDVSDLIAFYGHDRLPTGIQRVQIEAILGALADPSRDVRICCFIDGREDWLEVPPALFRMVTDLSVMGGRRNDRDWVAALNRLRLTLTLAEPFDFPFGAWLVNLGTSWWLRNYFLYVRHAKATRGIRYVPFVHDFIPVVTPEHCVAELTQDFISWAIGVFAHADHFLVNSASTKRDLVKVAAILGHEVTDRQVAVIRLDADFRKAEAAPLPAAALATFGLADEPYVLFVSTIESRKGHAVALDAWAELIRRHGAARVPKLVCVGRDGWLNDGVYARIAASETLASRVTMLSHISDAELALLYRECRFTLYPSLYEGWGLPVTEALCWGKPVISADSSSLPEAGGDFAVYVPAGEAEPLADAVERMAFDADWRAGWEARIAAGFRARSWRDIAGQIAGEVGRLAEKGDAAPGFAPPLARLGRWHPLRRSTARRIWPGAGSAEIFRSGLGWLWPDTDYCWTRPGGGSLTIGVGEGHPPLRIHLLLRAARGDACPWTLRIAGRQGMRGILPDGEARWIGFDYPAADDGGLLRLRLTGATAATVSQGHGQGAPEDHAVSIGLIGFFLCEAADTDTRFAFIEAASLGSIDQLDAYAEPVAIAREDDDAWAGD